jgi:hypothetical protein
MKDRKIRDDKRVRRPAKGQQEAISTPRSGLDPVLLAKQVLIKGENRKEFYDFVAQIRKEIATPTKIEEELLKKYIFSVWMLRRMREVEKDHLNRYQKISDEENMFSSKKRRIRDIKRVRIDGGLLAIVERQDKLEKQASKALRQLREERLYRKTE